MSRRRQKFPKPPSQPPRPPRWYDGYIQWLPKGAQRDIREMSEAPRAIVFLLLAGIVIGWIVANRFYGERFAVMEERVKQAQESAANANQTRSETNNNSARAALIAWGSPGPGRCAARLDPGMLTEYALKYDAAVACGTTFANRDRFTDPGITISERYTLADTGAVAIDVPVSNAMRSALSNWVKSEQARVMPAQLSVNLATWYEVLLIPKGVRVDEISTLADLVRLGGMIAPNQGRGAAIEGLSPAAFQ